jgi:DNA-binding NtrC family response regulator
MALILVVDDEADLRFAFRDALVQAGHDVRETDRVSAALYILAVAPIDLVVTDTVMPGQDGLEILTWMRQRRPRLPVIALDSRDTARALGAAATLVKPVAPGALLLAVDTVLQRDRQPEESPRAPEVPPTRMTLRLLLAEDSQDDADLLVRELEGEGYDVEAERVDTRETMAAALDRQEWDLVIGDYSMPQFRGTAALALLQERGLDTPFIFFSGTISDEVAAEALRAGGRDFVRKGDYDRLFPAVARELREAHPTERGSETILVVDDVDVVRKMARRMLERQGYTVLEAADANAALRIAAEHHGPIDLLLTDVVMPEIGGPELAERLARARPEIRVLFMSGYKHEAIAQHGGQEIAGAYLEKPFTPVHLSQMVRGVLDGA